MAKCALLCGVLILALFLPVSGSAPYIRMWTVDLLYETVRFSLSADAFSRMDHYNHSIDILYRMQEVRRVAGGFDTESEQAYRYARELFGFQRLYLRDDYLYREAGLEGAFPDSIEADTADPYFFTLPGALTRQRLEAFRDGMVSGGKCLEPLELTRAEIEFLLASPPGRKAEVRLRNECILRVALLKTSATGRFPVLLCLSTAEAEALPVPFPEPGWGIWTPFVWVWTQLVSIF